MSDMSNTSNPMVTISADEYFNLRSRAEANAYVMQSVESIRAELNNVRSDIFNQHSEIERLKNK